MRSRFFNPFIMLSSGVGLWVAFLNEVGHFFTGAPVCIPPIYNIEGTLFNGRSIFGAYCLVLIIFGGSAALIGVEGIIAFFNIAGLFTICSPTGTL